MEKQIALNMINKGEKRDTEFKLSKSSLPKNLFETICAFLNRFGGNIFLGVNDNKEIVGVDKNAVTRLKKEFANLCNNPEMISPTVYLEIEDVVIDDKVILYIYVPDMADVYRCRGRIYDRNEDGDYDVTNNTLIVSDMYMRKKDIHTEDKIFPYATIEDDLRHDVFEKARNMARVKNSNHPWVNMTDEEIIMSSGLYREDKVAKQKGLTLAAIVLFGTDEAIMSCAPSFMTDAIYREYNMDRYDDRDFITTNMIDTYYRLMAFVQKHTNDPFYLQGDQAISIRDAIARELCVNLIIHRELSSGYMSRIIITKESMYTENPCIPRNRGYITVENCIPHQNNPRIAKVFKEMGLADDLGSGIRNMTHYLEIYSGRKPILQDGEIFRSTIPIIRSVPDEVTEAHDKAHDKAHDEAHDKLSKILKFCSEPRDIYEIMNFMGFKNRTRFRRDYIKPLVNDGKICMTLPDKPTSKNQKYVTVKDSEEEER